MPCVLNLLGVFGFSAANCILGGQALASVSNGHLSWTYVHIYEFEVQALSLKRSVGIVIFTVISVIISFFGYRFLHW